MTKVKKHIFSFTIFVFIICIYNRIVRKTFKQLHLCLPAAVALCEETTSERGGEALYIIASKIYFIDNVSPD